MQTYSCDASGITFGRCRMQSNDGFVNDEWAKVRFIKLIQQCAYSP